MASYSKSEQQILGAGGLRSVVMHRSLGDDGEPTIEACTAVAAATSAG